MICVFPRKCTRVCSMPIAIIENELTINRVFIWPINLLLFGPFVAIA